MNEDVFGAGYAATYDDVYAEKDYASECDLLQELFTSHARRDVRSVLDLGCGTGRHALELARRGYEVVGVDRSPAMLERARKAASEADLDITFVRGDLRTTELEARFDAVIMMFAVLGYQLSDEDVAQSLRSAAHHLRAGGLFVFDVWYGPAVEAIGTDMRQREVVVGGKRYVRTSRGESRKSSPLVDVTISLDPVGAGDPIREAHTVRHFDREALAEFLARVGLDLRLLVSADDLSMSPDETTWNVIGAARREDRDAAHE